VKSIQLDHCSGGVVFTIFSQFQKKAVVTDTRKKREPSQDLNHCQVWAKGTQTKSIPQSPRSMLHSTQMQEEDMIVTVIDQSVTITTDWLSSVEECRKYLLQCILYVVNSTMMHQLDFYFALNNKVNWAWQWRSIVSYFNMRERFERGTSLIWSKRLAIYRLKRKSWVS
jgi:hypothetical protein